MTTHLTEAEITLIRERLGPDRWFEAQKAAYAAGHRGEAMAIVDGALIIRVR